MLNKCTICGSSFSYTSKAFVCKNCILLEEIEEERKQGFVITNTFFDITFLDSNRTTFRVSKEDVKKITKKGKKWKLGNKLYPTKNKAIKAYKEYLIKKYRRRHESRH